MRSRSLVARLAIALVLLAPALPAQSASKDSVSPLAAHFDAAGARLVQQLVDSAAASGVPASILMDKAVEGARKGASVARVLTVVRRYAGHLATARGVLGSGESNDVYQAAANALLAGVDVGIVRQLRTLRPPSALVFPLVVVTDLTLRGVPGDSAGAHVARLLGADAQDGDLAELQRSVAQGIVAGTRAADAASNATERAVRRLTLRPLPKAPPTDPPATRLPSGGPPMEGLGATVP